MGCFFDRRRVELLFLAVTERLMGVEDAGGGILVAEPVPKVLRQNADSILLDASAAAARSAAEEHQNRAKIDQRPAQGGHRAQRGIRKAGGRLGPDDIEDHVADVRGQIIEESLPQDVLLLKQCPGQGNEERQQKHRQEEADFIVFEEVLPPPGKKERVQEKGDAREDDQQHHDDLDGEAGSPPESVPDPRRAIKSDVGAARGESSAG